MKKGNELSSDNLEHNTLQKQKGFHSLISGSDPWLSWLVTLRKLKFAKQSRRAELTKVRTAISLERNGSKRK